MNNARLFTIEEVKAIVEAAKGYDLNIRVCIEADDEDIREQADYNTDFYLDKLKGILGDDEQTIDEITRLDPWEVDEDSQPIMFPKTRED